MIRCSALMLNARRKSEQALLPYQAPLPVTAGRDCRQSTRSLWELIEHIFRVANIWFELSHDYANGRRL
jgi:hypothetical protein